MQLDWKINCFDLEFGTRLHYERLGLCGVFLKGFASVSPPQAFVRVVCLFAPVGTHITSEKMCYMFNISRTVFMRG